MSSEKSFVSMGQKFCPICGTTFDDGTVLLETRFKPSGDGLMETMDRYTVTGIELCPEHQKMVDSGEYVMFFVCEKMECSKCKQWKPSYSNTYKTPSRTCCLNKKNCGEYNYQTPNGDYVYRTGDGFLIKKDVAKKIFSCDVAPINHCDMDTLLAVKEMSK